MKAVFVMRECVMAGKAAEVDDEVAKGLRALAEMEMFTILLDAGPEAAPGVTPATRWATLVEAAGGHVDAVVRCPHPPGYGCSCWGARPGLVLEAAQRFDLQPNECYLIATNPSDVDMGLAAGVRPILLLQGRTIGEVLGDRCTHKDYPVARQFTQAIDYIQTEELSTAQLGRPRQFLPPAPVEEGHPIVGAPAVTPISRQAVIANRRVRLRPRELARWLSLLVVGGVWLSLGIAYLLTDLYRVQPFPAVVWYLTLQFIPRVGRGALFILTGVAVVLLASRSFWHAFGNGQTGRRE